MTLRNYINDNRLARYINNSRAGKRFEDSAFARIIEYAIENSDHFIEGMGSAFDIPGTYYQPPMPPRLRTSSDDAKALKMDADRYFSPLKEDNLEKMLVIKKK